MNVLAFFHAYKFTHFSNLKLENERTGNKLSTTEKIKALIFGVNNPRPNNNQFPAQNYESFKLKSNREIECWSIKTENAKGTIILFHGYSGDKSSMVDKSDIFINLGYNTLLVDFMGSGGSEGNQTTIGFLEAEQVKTTFDFIRYQGENKIYLYGTSMGAVAVMKAISDYGLNPTGIIIECPFGSMYKTVCARFKALKVPTFPMAGLLVFWGGVQNGFWAFEHNPTDYAKNITCPILLMYGENDQRVSRQEIDEIFVNLKGKKQLKTYPNTGHENYLLKNKEQWMKDIYVFLLHSSKFKE
jgi:uncharacterized protein